MGEFNSAVERQRLLLEAEEWAKGTNSVHIHSLSSMWYDNRPEDTANGEMVTDTHFNDKRIERVKNGKLIHIFGKALKGDELIDWYGRNSN